MFVGAGLKCAPDQQRHDDERCDADGRGEEPETEWLPGGEPRIGVRPQDGAQQSLAEGAVFGALLPRFHQAPPGQRREGEGFSVLHHHFGAVGLLGEAAGLEGHADEVDGAETDFPDFST